MRERVATYIKEHGLIRKGDTVICGVSGGADSVALLMLLDSLRAELGFFVYAAHYNHMIRAEEADADEAYVVSLCKSLGLPLCVGRGDVPTAAKERGQTLETAARLMRYEFLEEVRRKQNARSIAVAHHMDDQAESIMLHITRGSGLKGLCGMQPRYGHIIRPLLCLRRAEIEQYLADHAVPYCTDSTNLLPDGMRNRIRLDVIPYIQQSINPAFIPALCALGELASEDEQYLETIARDALTAAKRRGGYDRASLSALPPPIRSRAIRIALSDAGARTDIERVHVDMIARLLSAGTGARADVAHISAWNEYSLIRFGRPQPEIADYCIPLTPSGETSVPGGRFISDFICDNGFLRDPRTAYMDADSLASDPVVRPRRPGDRFFPVGAPGERKLKEFFIDRKLPREARNMPLVCAGSTVLFVPGFGISEAVKITADTSRILRVRYIPNDFNGGLYG